VTPDERGAIAQILSEMSLLLAVSNVYLAGRYHDILDHLAINVGGTSQDDLKAARKQLTADLATSCLPSLLVNGAGTFVFVQPLATGKISSADLCAWGCDVFPLAYLIVFIFFALLFIWSIWLTGRTIAVRARVSGAIQPAA